MVDIIDEQGNLLSWNPDSGEWDSSIYDSTGREKVENGGDIQGPGGKTAYSETPKGAEFDPTKFDPYKENDKPPGWIDPPGPGDVPPLPDPPPPVPGPPLPGLPVPPGGGLVGGGGSGKESNLIVLIIAVVVLYLIFKK